MKDASIALEFKGKNTFLLRNTVQQIRDRSVKSNIFFQKNVLLTY